MNNLLKKYHILLLVLIVLVSIGGYVYFKDSRNEKQDGEVIGFEIIKDEFRESNLKKGNLVMLNNPKFELINDARNYLEDDSYGIGVDLNGESKFYPNQILVWHGGVNDTLGGKSILVSYCPVCLVGTVYDREVDGKTLNFEMSDKIYDGSLLVSTKNADTLWSTISGESVFGDNKGQEMNLLLGKTTTFSSWISEHPDSLVLSRDTGFNYPYQISLKNINTTPNNSGISDFVLGFEVSGKSYIVSLEKLFSEQEINLDNKISLNDLGESYSVESNNLDIDFLVNTISVMNVVYPNAEVIK